MDENIKGHNHNHNHPEDCRCIGCQMGMGGAMMGHGMCGYGCGHYGWRWVGRIILFIIIFWIGVQWGEMRVLAGYGHHMMGGWGYDRGSMMGNDYGAEGTGYTDPGTPAAPANSTGANAAQ